MPDSEQRHLHLSSGSDTAGEMVSYSSVRKSDCRVALGLCQIIRELLDKSLALRGKMDTLRS